MSASRWVGPREEVLKFLGLSVMDRFVVPRLILIDRKGMVTTRRRLLAARASAIAPQESFVSKPNLKRWRSSGPTAQHSTSVHKASSAPGAALAKN